MKKIDTGGPAFPQFRGSDLTLEDDMGMTLRDWFAGMALQGILANEMCFSEVKQIAEQAFKAADAMIEKRAARENAD